MIRPTHKNLLLTNPLFVILLAVVFLILLTVAGCGGKSQEAQTLDISITPTLPPDASPSPEITATPLPTPTATPPPLGTAGNPIIFGLVVEPDALNAAQPSGLADRLSSETSLLIEVKYYNDFTELLAALRRHEVHVTALPPLTYLLARQQGFVDVILVANHFGSFGYGTQILAHADSGFTSFYDTKTNLNTADALTALQQFTGRRPCWVEPQSLSGYVLPWGLFTEQGISLQPGAMLQTHAAVVRALYIQGICDFGATYATPGDPRTSSAVLDDLDDALSKVFIVWRSDAVIPNTNISVIPQFPALYRRSLSDALQNLVKNEDGKAILSQSLNYEVEDFKAVDDTYYEPLRFFTALAEIDLAQMVGK